MELLFSYVRWNPDPVIFTLGPLSPRWYGLLFASGFMIGLFIVKRMFDKEGAPEEWLDKAFLYIIIGAVLGARLGHVFFYDWPDYAKNPIDILKIWEGGLASHGGAIGILIAIWLFSRRVTKKSMLWTLDKVVVPTALAGSLIRLGNLINSEIIGKPIINQPIAQIEQQGRLNEVPAYAFVFEAIDELPRHPVQIYESLSYLIIFFILFFTYWRTEYRNKPGFLFGLFLALVFGVRFVLEYYKVSQGGFETAFDNALSTGQLLSIPFVIVGLYYIFRPHPGKSKKG